MGQEQYRWVQWGDLNAFFGLMLDNITNLVILTGILVGVFGYPAEKIYTLMIPGTALGVLVGDAVYTWLAFRLAKRSGRSDVTAMPLGLDTPSTSGIAFAVLGPVYLETNDAVLTWQVGMATLMLIGVFKVVLSFFGESIRRRVPQAGLLGSLAGIGIALLAFFPIMKIFSAPAAGLVSLGIILYSIVARQKLPLGIPGAFLAVAVGCLVFYLLNGLQILGAGGAPLRFEIHPALPIPTIGFIHGLGKAVSYLPIAFPFALLTVVGGINVTESARVAGDEYRTRDVLLTEAFATLIAALFGGVVQSTPYIGHPAYKAMGGRAAYTLATGLFIGVGAAFGIMSFVVEAIPEAAITPIILFIGIEIVSQAFVESPRNHAPAVAFATIPVLGYLVLSYTDSLVQNVGPALRLPEGAAADYETLRAVGHGFILTAMLWGGFLADLIDGKLRIAGTWLLLCGAFSLFGLIHSVAPSGDLYIPWRLGNNLVWQIALGYGLAGIALLSTTFRPRHRLQSRGD